MKYITVLFVTLFFCLRVSAQTITGQLTGYAHQSIRLEGFNGIETHPVSRTFTDSDGKFELNYYSKDYGVGYLIAADEKPFILILSGEDVGIRSEKLGNTQKMYIYKGQENLWYQQYAREHPRRDQALSAWTFLEHLYTTDSIFSMQQIPKQTIKNEIQHIQYEDAAFLNGLPEDSYVRWYLQVRKLISAVSSIAQYRTKEIPAAIEAFRTMDYADSLLHKSGLLKDAIESHFWLIENSGLSLDSMYIEMQLSIDAMLKLLLKDEDKMNEVTDHLFDWLESRSLIRASEHLALKVLNQVSCTIDSDLAKQLETYRAMKIGNIAPDIRLDQNVRAPAFESGEIPDQLTDLVSEYNLVVFGASWCPLCTEEFSLITQNYAKWKAKGIEVIYVSLDDNEVTHSAFTKDFPFITICDYKKWNSPIVQDYYVFATPTMYLLDRHRKILFRPNSVRQMNSWADWLL